VRTAAQLVARSVVLMVESTVALTVVYLAEQKVDWMDGWSVVRKAGLLAVSLVDLMVGRMVESMGRLWVLQKAVWLGRRRVAAKVVKMAPQMVVLRARLMGFVTD
jgi:hypothetical protein